jgi:hypothetical protein
MIMPTPKLTAEIITAAIDGYEFQKTAIDAKIAELKALLPGGSPEAAATPEPPTRKRKISAASRRKMALAQKARWAKIRGEAEPPAPARAEQPKPKPRISKEGMERIIAATKKRWRLQKAAAEAAAKKAPPTKTAVKKLAAKKATAKKMAPVTPATTVAAGQ